MNNIKAVFTAGVTALTVNGLHRWDYGRSLEIHSSDLPALVEVHFACPGMDEAEVRVCSVVGGVATAAIPDRCLEQCSPITAWVFVIDGTVGVTTKTVTLTVIDRTKPKPGATVPAEYSDIYTELISQVNDLIGQLADGTIPIASIARAEYADTAGTANKADELTFARTMSYMTLRGTDTAGVSFHLYYAYIAKSRRITAGFWSGEKEVFIRDVPPQMRVPATGQYGSYYRLTAIYHDGTSVYIVSQDQQGAEIVGELNGDITVSGGFVDLLTDGNAPQS